MATGASFVLRVHSPAVLAASGRAELARALERGDKVVLGHALLQELAEELSRRAGEALIFEVARAGAAAELHAMAVDKPPSPTTPPASTARITHVGVLEFSGRERDVAFLPLWVMRGLGVDEGAECSFAVRSLPPVTFLRLAARDARFFRAVAEP